MLLNQFNGGLNTRVRSQLINQTEAVIYENIDNSSGVIKPSNADTNLDLQMYRSFYLFNSNWVSYKEYTDFAEYGNSLYSSNGVGYPQKSSDGVTFSNLGIVGPTTAPSAVENPMLDISALDTPCVSYIEDINRDTTFSDAGGDLFSGVKYNYKLLFTNSPERYEYSFEENPNFDSGLGSITIDVTSLPGNTTTGELYRLYKGTYRKVGNLVANSITDATIDISANTSLDTYSYFEFGTVYEVAQVVYSGDVRKVVFTSLTFNESDGEMPSGIVFDSSLYTDEYYIKDGSGYYIQLNLTGNKSYSPEDVDTDIILDNVGVEGELQYCYTYYNSVDGTESVPSPYSATIVIANSSVDVGVARSEDTQVDFIRIYRIGGDYSSFILVDEVANTTQTYTDTSSDNTLSGNSVLDSFNNYPAPYGLDHLIEINSMMFGAVDNILHFSDVAFPDYWSPFYTISFNREITGIGEVPNGILVFTEYETFIVTGNSPSTLSKYLLSGSQGCISNRTVQYSDNMLVWASTDGICVSTGGNITVISKDKLGDIAISDIKGSAVHDQVYYLSYEDTTLALDFGLGMIYKNFSVSPDGFYVTNDTLYYSLDELLYSFGTGDSPKSLHWRSGKATENSISLFKNYKDIYVYCVGTVQFIVYIDGTEVYNEVLSDGCNDIKVPQSYKNGYSIEFEVIGTGIVEEIEFKSEKRQNGR